MSKLPSLLPGLLLAVGLAGCSLPPGAAATPQRPTFAFSPATTAAGTWELEAGAQLGPQDDYGEVPATLKYGLDEHTELSASLSPLISVDHTAGLGDAGLGWRHRLVDAEGGRPALAVQATLELPTADEDRGLGTGRTDAFGAFSAAGGGGDFGWVAFAQLGALGQAGEDPDLETDLALVGSWTLDASHALFAEYSDRRVHEQGTIVDQLRIGDAITLRPDFVLDVSLWLPASDDAPNTIVAVGFTRNLGPGKGP
jgi:hypothetical protein